MNNETVQFIESKGKFGMKLGLNNIDRLLTAFGNPQDKLSYIHVAGSNGKGSICRMLEKILIHHGYKTGLYTSPHLEHFNERIRFNGQEISDESINRLFNYIKVVCDRLVEKGYPYPTGFEIETAMAFLYFLEKKADIVILEVGLGGRLDATNIIADNLISIITSIGLEHTKWLGDTYEEIAREKAAIIKPGSHVIISPQVSEADQTIISEANQRGAVSIANLDESMITFKENHDGIQYYEMLGEIIPLKSNAYYQQNNLLTALAAIQALKSLGYNLDQTDQALKEVEIPGRFEFLHENPFIILDGAHNPDGIEVMIESLKKTFPGEKITFFFGSLEEKHVETSVKKILPLAEKIYLLEPDNPEALNTQDLKAIIKKQDPDIPIKILKSVSDICRYINLEDKNKIYMVTGSLYLIGPARTALNEYLNSIR